jgi:flagellar biosynthesis/type III secretory pathway protein FliH
MKARARVIRAGDASEGGAAGSAASQGSMGAVRDAWRRITREEMEGRERAAAIVRAAQAEAEATLGRARTEAASAAAGALAEARQDADAELTARWVALRDEEQKRVEGGRETVIALGVALAERLLGASLQLDPGRIIEVARGVLAEARGARRARIDAHPVDAAVLREKLAAVPGLDVQTVEVRDDAALARGELRLHTDVGTIDARLAPRFERLAAALRDAIR